MSALRDGGERAPEHHSLALSRAAQFDALLEVGRKIGATSTPAAIFSAVREAAVGLLRGTSCHIALVNGDADDIVTDGGDPAIDLSPAIVSRAVALQGPVVTRVGDDADSGDNLEEPRSVMCVPILNEGRVVACFYLMRPESGGLFGHQEVELAEVIGTLASAALDRVAGSEAHLRSVAQNPFDVITIVNPEGRITHQSASIEQAFGYLPRSMIGEELTSWFHPEDVDKLSQFLDSTNNEETASGLVWARMRHRDGTWRVGESAVSTLHDPTTQGIVLITRDVSEQFPLDSELGLRGMQDSLTGLANRELFIDRLNNALARRARDRRPLSVLLVDVDELAHINDKLGRGAGDLVLQQTGERLEKCIRPSDLVARFGANEFALLLENADAPTADIIAKRILAAFIPPFSILDGEEPVGVTVGAAVTLDRETSDEMLQGAQAGMQAARSRGEDRYQLFGSEKHEAAADRSALRKDLEWALLRAELVIHYQPVVDLVSGSISGFEALVRWNHPSRGLLGPDQFLDLAEENGTIISIGGWVLRFACQQVAVWRRAIERDLTIAVNMSDRQLQDPGLEAKVRAALAASELPASALVIEVMESATVEETTGTIEILNSLKQIGVKVAIDDFGNGFSSLSHLRDYPVDQLKMDRSFVSDVVANPEDHAVVSSVISLGHALDLCVVAVGVETPDQLNELREMGCDQGQGFRWRKPSPAQSVSDWLASLDDHAVAV